MYLNGEELYSDKNFHFGGTNLITGTSNFDGFQLVNVNLQSSKDIFGNKQALINNPWTSAVKLINVFAGQIICYSAAVQAVSKTSFPTLGLYAGDNKYGGTANVENGQTINSIMFIDNHAKTVGQQIADNNQHIIHGFFKITKSGALSVRIESYDSNPWLISSVKAELGTIHTNWSPAPQDLVSRSEFEALQTKVNSLTKNQNWGGKAPL